MKIGYNIFVKVFATFITILFVAVSVNCGMAPKDKAVSILKKGISDKSDVIKVNAARALIETGDNQGYEIIYRILQTGNSDAIVSALGVLVILKDINYSPVLVQLSQHEDPLVRTEAYHLISLSGNTEYRTVLLKGANDRISRVRRYAYQGLVNFKDKNVISPGLKDSDPIVRIIAAKSLGLLGEKEVTNFIKKEMDPKNPNPEVWAYAVLALAELGDTLSIPYIKELLFDTPWDLRIAAAEALLILKDNSGVEVLKSGLQSGDPFVRVKSVEVMAHHPHADFYELLTTACRDEYINVSIGAINALVNYHKKESLKLFEDLLDAPNPLVKIAAASAYLRTL